MSPLSPSPPTPPKSITLPGHPSENQGATFQGGLRRLGNRSWRSPRGKCTGPQSSEHTESRGLLSPLRHLPAACPRTPAEFHGSTLWSHPFASMRFHVLLNSLFKVLFNFPSRYLFAIGLVPVFSLRWSLPPTLGCIPKQPDSGDQITRDRRPGVLWAYHPLRVESRSGELGRQPPAPSAVPNTTTPAGQPRPGDSVLGSSLFTRRY